MANGMSIVTGWGVIRDFGVKVGPITLLEKRLTIAKFLPRLDAGKTYIVVVNNHVFAVKDGIIFDKALTHRRTVVEGYIEFL